MIDEWRKKVVSYSGGSTSITSDPAIVKGVYINALLSAHSWSIEDGSSGEDFVIPASAPAGSFYDFERARFEEGVTVDPSSATAGEIVVLYRDMEPL